MLSTASPSLNVSPFPGPICPHLHKAGHFCLWFRPCASTPVNQGQGQVGEVGDSYLNVVSLLQELCEGLSLMQLKVTHHGSGGIQALRERETPCWQLAC